MVIYHDKKRVELWAADITPRYVGGYVKGSINRLNLSYRHFKSNIKQEIKYLVERKGYHVVFWDDDKTNLILYNK